MTRAATLTAYGRPPVATGRGLPAAASGQMVVTVTAAPITPLDVLCATGTSYFGAPSLPYVPGVQGVGTLDDGSAVWFPTTAGMRPGDGSMASHCVAARSDLVELPAGADHTLVAALGLSAVAARMALVWRGGLVAGEQVVVLGAGGAVGQVGVQVARMLGARRVIAVCRSAEARERAARLGADAVVELLASDDADALAGRLREACDGAVDVVLDPVFGVPASAALRVLGPHGRLVNLGGAAGERTTFDSSTLRGRSLRVLGYTNNELTPEQRAAAVREVAQDAAAGRLVLDYEAVPLADVESAWARQASGEATRRIVLVP